jgi:hypothetical protein
MQQNKKVAVLKQINNLSTSPVIIAVDTMRFYIEGNEQKKLNLGIAAGAPVRVSIILPNNTLQHFRYYTEPDTPFFAITITPEGEILIAEVKQETAEEERKTVLFDDNPEIRFIPKIGRRQVTKKVPQSVGL